MVGSTWQHWMCVCVCLWANATTCLWMLRCCRIVWWRSLIRWCVYRTKYITKRIQWIFSNRKIFTTVRMAYARTSWMKWTSSISVVFCLVRHLHNSIRWLEIVFNECECANKSSGRAELSTLDKYNEFDGFDVRFISRLSSSSYFVSNKWTWSINFIERRMCCVHQTSKSNKRKTKDFF